MSPSADEQRTRQIVADELEGLRRKAETRDDECWFLEAVMLTATGNARFV